MPDFDRRLRKLDEIQTPDLWERAESGAHRTQSDPGRRDPSPGRKFVTIGVAFALSAVAGAFLLQLFDIDRVADHAAGGGALGPVAQVVVSVDDGAPNATLTFDGQTRAGETTLVIQPNSTSVNDPRPDSAGTGEGGRNDASIPAWLGVDAFSFDLEALESLRMDPISITADAIFEVSGKDEPVVLIMFRMEDGSATFLPNPTDLRLLEPGRRYRVVVVGPLVQDSIFQLAFDIDIQPDTDSPAASADRR